MQLQRQPPRYRRYVPYNLRSPTPSPPPPPRFRPRILEFNVSSDDDDDDDDASTVEFNPPHISSPIPDTPRSPSPSLINGNLPGAYENVGFVIDVSDDDDDDGNDSEIVEGEQIDEGQRVDEQMYNDDHHAAAAIQNGEAEESTLNINIEHCTCVICLENPLLRKPTVLKCGHLFCLECITNAILRRKLCPYRCSQEVTLDDLIKIHLN